MNIRVGIFGLLFGIAVMGLSGQERFHTVQRGETFYSIARSLGIKAEDLMSFNGISDPSKLQAGQRLRIPDSRAAENASGAFTTYRVASGDTLYGIARRFSVTVGAIQEANNLSPNSVLREGVSLRIPTGAAPSSASATAPSSAAAPSSGTTAQTPASRPAGTGTAVSTASSLRWPVSVREMSYMVGKLNGVVITGTRAEPVISLTWGTVLSAGPYRGFGKVVIVQVDGGYLYVYGGCESLSVKEGDRVGPGIEIGKLGIDAVSNKPQLFFMVYRSNTPIDPAEAPRA